MRTLAIVVGLLVWLAAAAPASAEDIAAYEVEGEADASGSDPRVAALDAAFVRAAGAALADVLDSDVRKANKAVIDREILGRARLWVAKFTVTRDDTADGRRQLSVTVRVDRDKMRARLDELTLTTPAPDGAAPAVTTRGTIVLLRIADPERTRATYGQTAEKDVPGLGALSAQLRQAGLAIKRAPAAGPAARATGDLPLDDDEAAALAAEAKADTVAIAGVTVGAPVAVRGVASPGVLVTAHLRVVEKGKVLGQGTATVAARGSESTVIGAAIDRALVAAAADAVPAKQAIGAPAGFEGDDTPIAEPGVVLVRLSPKTPFALVAAEVKYLAGAKGVSRAALRRLSPGGWVIGVTTTESIQKIANLAKKAPTAESTAQVKVVGELVEVALR